MKPFAALAAVAALGALAACGDATPKRPTAEQDVAAIMEFNKHYLGAINDEDMKTLGALTTDGHVMIAPNRPPIVGKAANDAMNGRAFEQFEFDESWSPVETVRLGRPRVPARHVREHREAAQRAASRARSGAAFCGSISASRTASGE